MAKKAAATKAERPSRSTKGKRSKGTKGSSVNWLAMSICIVLVSAGTYYIYNNPKGFSPLQGERHQNKPYESFLDFYPHYQREHSDETCRLLHIIGTCLVLTIMALSPATLVSMALGFVAAYPACGLFSFMPHGDVEAAILVVVFFTTHHLLTGSIKKALLVTVIGYAFAWVGHFYFEHNKPATFIYPSYSLLSDFYMTFRVLTLAEPLSPDW